MVPFTVYGRFAFSTLLSLVVVVADMACVAAMSSIVDSSKSM